VTGSRVVRVIWKDEGDFGFIAIVTEADLDGVRPGIFDVGYDPDRARPRGTLAEAQALAAEHGVDLEVC